MRLLLSGLFAIGLLLLVGRATAVALAADGQPAFARSLGLGDPRGDDVDDVGTLFKKKPIDAGSVGRARARAEADPFDGNAFMVAGMAAMLRGDETGRALVRHALALNPRSRAALLWLLEDALQGKRVKESTELALRLVSLDRQNPRYMLALVELSRNAEARAIIAPRLKTDLWSGTYLNALSDSNVDRAAVFEMLRGLAGEKTSIAKEQHKFAAALFERQEYDRAYLAWLQWLTPEQLEGIAYLYDGEFRGLGGVPPFNWTFSDAGAGSAQRGNGPGLEVDFSGREPVVLATQALVLQPGHYRLASTSKLTQHRSEMFDGKSAPIYWQLDCQPGNTTAVTLDLPTGDGNASKVRADFTVDAACKGQILTLRGRPQDIPGRASGRVVLVAIEAVK